MPKVKIYSRYDVPAYAGLSCPEPTRTQQHFADEVDINKIISRAISTGDTTVFTTTERAQYFDCSNFEDYQASLDFIAGVEEDFYSLPSRVRKEFDNNPDNYVEFMTDPRNYAKAVELGLLEGGEITTSSETSESGPLNPPGGPSETVLSSQSDA
ncbi:hypothetical protein BFG07_08490 [Kosakonia cowanii]|uniref:hypothetical protein n=1 Tax=Kosakonia cowanii TaxID=208223 RepID=UPI000B96D9AF|nr:hypothetical protein [Kosakonia cowanii]AST68717.1 hypothetical protein BFG07_08490 [Kosakonia cowanii]